MFCLGLIHDNFVHLCRGTQTCWAGLGLISYPNQRNHLNQCLHSILLQSFNYLIPPHSYNHSLIYSRTQSLTHSLTYSLNQSINQYLLIICTRPDTTTCTHTKALARPGAQKIEQKPRCCRHRKGRAHQVQKSAQTRGREPQVRMAQASRRPEALGRAQYNGDGGKD